jgi:hypothetical protein
MHHRRHLVATQWQCSSAWFASGLDRFSDVVIRSVVCIRPEPKGGEQICCLFNEVRVVRSPGPAGPGDLLLCLLSELIESGHESAVSHRTIELSPAFVIEQSDPLIFVATGVTRTCPQQR